MRTYILYNFKVWRYVFVAVGFILFIIFGLLYLAQQHYFEINDHGGIYFFIIAFGSMALGVIIGAKVSTYTYEIALSNKGLKMNIQSPFLFSGNAIKSILWEEIEAYNLEEYENGSVLNFSLHGADTKYSFTNSIFKKSKDLVPFYEALKKGADAFNDQYIEEHKKIGMLAGFYEGPYALWLARLLVILMIGIPIVIMIAKPDGDNYFQYIKLIWFYVLSFIIIFKTYIARKKTDE